MAKKKNTTIGYIVTEKSYTAIGYIFKLLFRVFTPRKLSRDREVSNLNLLLFSVRANVKRLAQSITRPEESLGKRFADDRLDTTGLCSGC